MEILNKIILKDVINAIGKFLKLNNITYSKQKIADKRDYKVNFQKIFKDLKFKQNLIWIMELKK